MEKCKVLKMLCLLLGLTGLTGELMGVFAASEYLPPKVEKFHLKAKHIDQTFEIHVLLPRRLKDGSERFPTLYMTDSNGDMLFKGITKMIQASLTPRYITIGIGYLDGQDAGSLRVRDFSPKKEPSFQYFSPKNWRPEGGGAEKFLAFIREELMPAIDAKYPTIPNDRGYYGDSLGGVFGLHVLFNHPESFGRYIIGSAGYYVHGGRQYVDMAEEYIASGKRLNAKLFIGVGDEEDLEFRYKGNAIRVPALRRLEHLFADADFPDLELTTRVFEGQNHMSVIPLNYFYGAQAVFGVKPCDDPLSVGTGCTTEEEKEMWKESRPGQ